MRISVEFKEQENYYCVQFTTPNSNRCYGLTKEQLEHLIKEAQEALKDHEAGLTP